MCRGPLGFIPDSSCGLISFHWPWCSVRSNSDHQPRVTHPWVKPGKWRFPGGSVVKNLPTSAEDAEDASLVPGLGRSPGGGNGNPLQCFCLENPMDRQAQQSPGHGVKKGQTELSMRTCYIGHRCLAWHINNLHILPWGRTVMNPLPWSTEMLHNLHLISNRAGVWLRWFVPRVHVLSHHLTQPNALAKGTK